jgi:hypothetical protein
MTAFKDAFAKAGMDTNQLDLRMANYDKWKTTEPEPQGEPMPRRKPDADEDPRFTDEEKAKCALREAAWRRRVYPNAVAKGRMTQAQADREIAMMDEIAAEFAARTELPL